MTDDYWDGKEPTISNVGHALVALEDEYNKLEQDIKMLMQRAGLAMQKQRICLEAMRKISLNIGSAALPE